MGNEGYPDCPLLIRAEDEDQTDFEICKYCTLPLLVLDSTGKAIKVNDALKLIWEVDPEKVLRSPGYNIFDDSGFKSQKVMDQIESAFGGRSVKLELKEYKFPAEFRIAGPKKAGSRRVSVCAAPVVQGDRLKAVYLFYHDEIQTKNIINLERQCRQLAAFVNSFAELKHEINNPLLLITGNAQLLLAKTEGIPQEMAQKLGRILTGAEKIREILVQHESVMGTICSGEELELAEEL